MTESRGVPPVTKWKLPAWISFGGSAILINMAWEWVFKPGGEYLATQSSGAWEAIKNWPVAQAANLSTFPANANFAYGGGEFVVACVVVWFIYRKQNASLPRFHFVIIFLAGVFFTNYAIRSVARLGSDIYVAFNTNVIRAGPVLSADEERILRSRFALMTKRADLDAINKELRVKLDSAKIPYYER